jgi:ABC-type proline/glycine betaine transport system permease subunit
MDKSTILSTLKFATVPTAIVIWNAFIAALPTVILVLTFVSVVVSIGYTIWKWRKEYIEHRDNIQEDK